MEAEEEEMQEASKKDVEKEQKKQTRNLSNDIQWNGEVSDNSRWEELEQFFNVMPRQMRKTKHNNNHICESGIFEIK